MGLLAVAGCSSSSPSRAPAPTAPRIVEQRQSQLIVTRLPQTDADMCKAGELQWLVGKPKTEIPVPVDVVNRRVACTTCPVTEDYSPYRLNIFYNQKTGIVERVGCG
ncbi:MULTISPECIES: hypothetical protein [unclassified Brevundimonas]|uniref:hypothetical protein n=1 Tax=unclassified Brevundimonas TaxID=2622653 RepID=UPI003F9076E6